MNSNFKILVVEDEVFIAQHLTDVLEDFGFEVIANCNNYNEGKEALLKANYDIALLDINLNEENISGLDLAKICKAQKKPYIFLTAYSDSETISKASILIPNAYLIKPVQGSSLFAAIQVALANFNSERNNYLEQDPNYLFIKLGNKNLKIYWQDVEAITHDKNYIKLVSSSFQTQGYLIRSSLSNALTSLIPQNLKPYFVQINRSTIINTKKIKSYSSKEVELPCGMFDVGETFNQSLLASLI